MNFRDYLNINIETAKKYAALKITIAENYPNNRKLYTQGKSELIEVLLSDARQCREKQKIEGS